MYVFNFVPRASCLPDIKKRQEALGTRLVCVVLQNVLVGHIYIYIPSSSSSSSSSSSYYFCLIKKLLQTIVTVKKNYGCRQYTSFVVLVNNICYLIALVLE